MHLRDPHILGEEEGAVHFEENASVAAEGTSVTTQVELRHHRIIMMALSLNIFMTAASLHSRMLIRRRCLLATRVCQIGTRYILD